MFGNYKHPIVCMNCLVSNNYKFKKGTKILGSLIQCKKCGCSDEIRVGTNGLGCKAFYIN